MENKYNRYLKDRVERNPNGSHPHIEEVMGVIEMARNGIYPDASISDDLCRVWQEVSLLANKKEGCV